MTSPLRRFGIGAGASALALALTLGSVSASAAGPVDVDAPVADGSITVDWDAPVAASTFAGLPTAELPEQPSGFGVTEGAFTTAAAATGKLRVTVPQATSGAVVYAFSDLGREYRDMRGSIYFPANLVVLDAGETAVTWRNVPRGNYKFWVVYAKGSRVFGGEFVGGTVTPARADVFRVKPNTVTKVKATSSFRARDYGDSLGSGGIQITGDYLVGEALTAGKTALPGTSFEWIWMDNLGPAVAPKPTFVLNGGQLGNVISVVGVGYRRGYQFATFTTGSDTVGVNTLTLSPEPTINGAATVGAKVYAYNLKWDRGTSLTYEWLLNGVEIPGATGSTLWITEAMSGGTLALRVTGVKPGFETVVRVSESETVGGSIS